MLREPIIGDEGELALNYGETIGDKLNDNGFKENIMAASMFGKILKYRNFLWRMVAIKFPLNMT